MAGALPALERHLDRPLSEADLVVGTSAGSVMAAALRCRVPVESIIVHQHPAVRVPIMTSALVTALVSIELPS